MLTVAINLSTTGLKSPENWILASTRIQRHKEILLIRAQRLGPAYPNTGHGNRVDRNEMGTVMLNIIPKMNVAIILHRGCYSCCIDKTKDDTERGIQSSQLPALYVDNDSAEALNNNNMNDLFVLRFERFLCPEQ